jgi:hypothetical protein
LFLIFFFFFFFLESTAICGRSVCTISSHITS